MISGIVERLEARIPISVTGPEGSTQEIVAVIDTGFSGSLTLPAATVASLNLNWQHVDRGMLADGSVCLFDVFEAEVVWDGQVRRVLVDEADTDPLVGMSLLSGYELKVEVRSQGKVEVTPLPSSNP